MFPFQMIKFVLQMLLVGLLLFVVSICRSQEAPGHGPPDRLLMHRHLATKTPYTYVANNDSDEVVGSGCVARQFWLLSRHGTRYASERGMRHILETLPEMAREIRYVARSLPLFACVAKAVLVQ